MASTGADFEAARRRNVPHSTAPEVIVDRVEVDDKKAKAKKVREDTCSQIQRSCREADRNS